MKIQATTNAGQCPSGCPKRCPCNVPSCLAAVGLSFSPSFVFLTAAHRIHLVVVVSSSLLFICTMTSLNRLALRSLPSLAAAQQSLSSAAVAAVSASSSSYTGSSSIPPLFINNISKHRQFNSGVAAAMRTYATTPNSQSPNGSDILASYSSSLPSRPLPLLLAFTLLVWWC